MMQRAKNDTSEQMNCSALSPSSFYSYSPSASSSMLHYLNEINNNNTNVNFKKSSSPQADSDLADHTLNNISWIPPNDRELVMRAKLKTGWSSRGTSNVNTADAISEQKSKTSASKNQAVISEAEFQEIEQVMQRASMTEKKEIDRINNLLQRYKTMNKPLGNGETTCYICNSNFGILGANPRICNDCLKNVCTTCSIDSLTVSKHTTIWLCKICAEYRDLLKKSGAWFNKKLPANIKEAKTNPNQETPPGSLPLSFRRSSKLFRSNQTNSPKLNDKNNNEYSPQAEKKEAHKSGSESLDTNESAKVKEVLSESSLVYSSVNEEDEDLMKKENKSNVTRKSPSGNLIEESNKKPANKEDNSKTVLENFELENKQIQEKIAASKHLLNTNKTNNMNASTPKTNDESRLTKKSDESSTSNISMAFNQFKAQTELELQQNDLDAKLGIIEFSVEYIESLLQLKVHLMNATNLVSKDSNGLSDPYVKLHLLPGIAKSTKLRSKTVYKNLNPVFDEYLHYDGVTADDIYNKILRLTVLDEDKFGFDFIGEYRLPLKTLIRNEINHFKVALEEKQELGDETDTNSRGKINFALKYCKLNKCLYVKINRCIQLLPMDNGKSSDPFVEIALVPSSKENKHKFKTSVKWKTLDPEYLEEFKFSNVDLKTLLTKTIEINVWDKDFGKNDFIGCVQLDQQRSGDELKHFFTMVKNPDIYHEQWHTLHLKESNETSDVI